jgi:hypothetical protein
VTTIQVDYEGQHLTTESAPEDTHIVVSQQRNGELRIQPTHDLIAASSTAQVAGDGQRRVAPIRDGRAVFTVLPPYDPYDADPLLRRRRHSGLTILGVLALLVALIMALAL